MSLRARIGQVEREVADLPCALCRDVRDGMTLTIAGKTQEEMLRDDYNPEGVEPEPEHPLIVALEEAFPEDDELHCPGCGRVILRQVTLNIGKDPEEGEE